MSLGLPDQPVQAQSASLTITPDAALAGERVVLAGAGFPAETPGQLVWAADSTAFAEIVTDAAGSFAVELIVPAAPPGAYVIAAVVGGGAVSAEAALTITGDAANPAAEPTGAPGYLPIVSGGSSENGPDSDVVFDSDPTTQWLATPTSGQPDAAFWLDLGEVRPVASVRFLLATAGAMGEFDVLLSQDGETWVSLATLDGAALESGVWYEQPVDAWTRYVQFRLANPDGLPELGGFAEVEVWPGADARPLAEFVTPEPETETPPPTQAEATEAVSETSTATTAPTEPGATAAETAAVTGSGAVSGTDGDGVNCRVAPDTDAEVIEVVAEGTAVELLGSADAGWQPIRCAGRQGYVLAEFVTVAGTAKPTATQPTATEPSATQPTATKPAAAKPTATEQRLAAAAATTSYPPGERNPSFSGRELRIAASSGSSNATNPTRTYDNNSGTTWTTTSSSSPRIAHFTLDLGSSARLTGLKWLYHLAGSADEVLIQISPDNATWRTVGRYGNTPAGTWHGVDLARDGRYIRFTFLNPNGDAVLGHSAEVEVWGSSGTAADAKVGGSSSVTPTSKTIIAAADAEVQAASPNTNYGTGTEVVVDTSPNREVFLRFNVTGLSGPVQKAILRLKVNNGTANGPAVASTSANWSETGLTWNTRPALGSLIGNKRAISGNTWVEYDVTTLVRGNGNYGLALRADSTDGLYLAAREAGANRPHLVVQTGGGPAGTPAPTPTSTATPTGTPSPTPTATPQPDGQSCSPTLQALVDAAAPGAVVKVPKCVYREQVAITKPITLDGQGVAEIRGSDLWNSGWTLSGAYWVRGTVPSFPVGAWPCQSASNGRCNWPEQVFFDGQPLYQVASNPASGQFAIDSARRVVLADNPAGHVVEVTARPYWLNARASGVTIRGFTMKHAATPAQRGAINNGGYANWVIQDNVLSDAHGAVVSFYGPVSELQLLNNDISRGGQLGIHGTQSIGAKIVGNRIHHNQTEQFETGWEGGGLKMTLQDGLLLAGNEVDNNAGPGLWCDIDCADITISSNRVHHNHQMGIFFEISDGARIDGNSVWENGWGFTAWGWGAGILIAGSSNTDVYNNTVAWNADGISVISQNRGEARWNQVRGNYIHDNTIIGEQDTTLLGYFQDWAGSILYDPASNNRGSTNHYWSAVPDGVGSRWEWAGPLGRIADWNETRGEDNGRYLSSAEQQSALTTAGIPTSGARTPSTTAKIQTPNTLGNLAPMAAVVLLGWRARGRQGRPSKT